MPDLAAWVNLLTSVGPSGLLLAGLWMIIKGLLQPQGQVTTLIEQMKAEFTRTVEQKDREFVRMVEQKESEYARMVAAKDSAAARLEEDLAEWKQMSRATLATLVEANTTAIAATETAFQVAQQLPPQEPPPTTGRKRTAS